LRGEEGGGGEGPEAVGASDGLAAEIPETDAEEGRPGEDIALNGIAK
jgi:hypothetical protein